MNLWGFRSARGNQELLTGVKRLVRRQVVQFLELLYAKVIFLADPVESFSFLNRMVFFFAETAGFEGGKGFAFDSAVGLFCFFSASTSWARASTLWRRAESGAEVLFLP